MGAFVKEEFDNIKKIAAQGVPFEVAENMVLGTDHAEIGAQILAKMVLSPVILSMQFAGTTILNALKTQICKQKSYIYLTYCATHLLTAIRLKVNLSVHRPSYSIVWELN